MARKGNPNPTGLGEWKNQWVDKDKARAAGIKGNEQKRINEAKRKELKKLTANKQEFLDNAIDALHNENPEFLNDILKSLSMKASGDGKDAIQAAGILLDYAGIRAPKQTEIKVEDTSTIEETTAELRRLGVTVIK